jgi:hypothetical protein
VVTEIRSGVAQDEYVLPAQRFRDPGVSDGTIPSAARPNRLSGGSLAVWENARAFAGASRPTR